MSKMNIEVMEQLLKDLAANVGYDLIPEPFDPPFEEASIEGLLNSKQFFWPVPVSVLNDKEHKEFRKMCVEADIIDTVCTTSLPWPSDENDHVAILLIDVTRRRRGCIKFIHADKWDISKDIDMAGVCNMLIHDLFPGEEFLAYELDGETIDVGLDDPWNEQVCIYAACDIKKIESLLPTDYIHRLGYGKNGMYIIADVFDIIYPVTSQTIANLKTPAILLSTIGKLRPQIVEPNKTLPNNSFDRKMLLVPNDEYVVDYDSTLHLFEKEEVLRQLPITRKITISDMWRVQIENDGLFKERYSFEEKLAKLLAYATGDSDNS